MTSERMEADGREANPDLTRMLGVWVGRGSAEIAPRVVLISSVNADKAFISGAEPMPGVMDWDADGTSEDGEAFDLTERIASLGDLRMAADVLMGKRLYAAAAVLYQLLGDEEQTEDAIGRQRAVIAAEKEKPF